MSQTLDTKTTAKWQPYPEYKDSGIAWLGEIPSHWETKRLKVFASVNMGQSPSSEECNQNGIGLPFLQGNADFGNLHPSPKTYCETARKTALQDDILLSVRAPVGQMNVADQTYGIGRGLCAITPHSDIDRNYLWFLLYLIREELSSVSTGSTYDAVSVDEVKRLTSCLPPLPEQRAIAAFLDRETASINTLIAKKQHLIDLLREKRTALISHAVTKGLDPTAPMKDSGVAWLGEIPQGWEVHSLRRVVDTFVDYRGFTPAKTDSGTPLVTARNIKNGIIDFTLSKEFISEEDYPDRMVRGFPKIGDVLVTTEAPLGETAQIVDEKIALAQRIILLKVNKSLITNDYLKHYLSSEAGKAELWSRATGSTAVGIKASHLREIFIIVPFISEQIEIVQLLKKETARIDALISTIEEGIKKLQEYSTALISATPSTMASIRRISCTTSCSQP